MWFPAGMANILGDEQRQQILALGRLGWPLRRIERATGIRRETASTRPPGARGGRPAGSVSKACRVRSRCPGLPRCGGRLRVVATVQDPAVVRTLLALLGRASAREPPGPA